MGVLGAMGSYMSQLVTVETFYFRICGIWLLPIVTLVPRWPSRCSVPDLVTLAFYFLQPCDHWLDYLQ